MAIMMHSISCLEALVLLARFPIDVNVELGVD